MLSKSGAARLGQIWVPQPDINLSAEAGTALRELTLRPIHRGERIAPEIARVCLAELGSLVAHRLGLSAQAFSASVRDGNFEDLHAAAEKGGWRRRPIHSLLTLKDKALQ